jgi:acetyl esterase/lipase
MKIPASLLPALLSLGVASAQPAAVSSENNARLRDALQKFPQADTDGDGILSLAEGLALAKFLGIDPATGLADAGAVEGVEFKSNITYGPKTREVLDFWQPTKSTTPTPVVILIHGGGFKGGDKTGISNEGPMVVLRNALLQQGIAVAAIDYPFVATTPLNEILHDGARAVQFLRSKSSEWNIDKAHFGALGVSAGAGMSLWLTTRDDLADAKNSDPVLRESSKIGPVVLIATQATYNLPRWDLFLGKPNFEQKPNEAAEMFHFPTNEDLRSAKGKAVLDESDMLAWLGKGDGPILAFIGKNPGSTDTWDAYVHNPLHAREIKKVSDQVGVDCEVITPTGPEALAFFVKNLK